MSVVANVAVNLDARRAKANSDALKQKVTQLNRTLDKTGKSAASATANVQRFGIAFRSVIGPIVGVVGAVNLLSRSLKILGERQADAVVLANGLEKIGGTRADLLKLQKVADELGKQTLFNQEDFDRGFALLTSFQSIGIASYERVAKAAADVAQVTRQDVNSSLLQLAKALQDPVKGLTALARSGTQFTEAQQDLIKSLVASGKELEAQDFILKEIEKQYGNAAAAAGSAGYAGAVDSLGESFRDFQERLAKGVEPAVVGTLKALTDLFELVNKIPEPVGRAALAIGSATAALVALRAAALAAIPALKSLLVFIVANPWFALAAGIGAATIALAGYRTETQKLAGAASTGDATAISSSRKQLSETEQKISALSSIRRPSRAQVSELNRLRRQAAELRRGITTGTAALTAGPTPRVDVDDSIDGGGAVSQSKADKAIRDAERLAELIKQQIKAADDQNFALKNQLAITKELDPVRKRFVEYEIKQSEIAKQYNELKEQAKSSEELILINANQILDQRIAQIEYEREINELIEQRARLMIELTRAAAMPTVYNELEQQDAVLQSVLDKYPAIGAAADSAASMVTTGVGEMIAGTKSAEQVFIDFLKSVADALLNTAKQMIAQYIAIGIARIFAGLGSGSSGMDFTPVNSLPSAGLTNALPTSFAGFAEGGFVTGPTRAMIGEGGESEYVIPSSKMQAAMARYSRGARGEAVIPATGGGESDINAASAGPVTVDVRYSVERINDVEYVTADQFREGMRQAAQQGASQGEQRALRQLQQNTSVRGRVGLR